MSEARDERARDRRAGAQREARSAGGDAREAGAGAGAAGSGARGAGSGDKSGKRPMADGERRLTAGERNELRRQERRAARRTDNAASEPRRGSSQRGSGGARGTDSSRAAGAARGGGSSRPAGASRSGGASRAAGASRGGDSPRAGGSDGAGSPRTPASREKAAPGDHTGSERKPVTASEPRRDQGPKRHRHREAARIEAGDDVYRAGFACFVGRPNAGKSTLTNAIIGQKIAITSNKPQTTRHVIRGILHRENAQLVLVDTPGLHRPRTLLGERLNDLVREVWSEVDVIGVCFPADEPVGRGDRFISAEMAELKATIIAVVTKVDLVDPATLAKHLIAVSELHDFADIVPVSAVSGHQVQTLVDVLVKHLPESPQLYPDDVLTDEPEQVLIAELIREAALEGVRDELPHSIAVLVEEMMVENGVTKIYADLYVERDSQKSIVIGSRGARLKEVGSRARAEIESLLGSRVYLDLHVRVAKEWQRDPRQLRKLGF